MAVETSGKPCPFCAIARGAANAWIVDEDRWAMSFLDIAQATPGHTLVVPRAHTADLWTVSSEDAERGMAAVHRVAALLRDRLRPDGLTLTQATRPAAGQDVFHLHVLVPRYADDRLVPSWQSGRTAPAELTRTWQLLRPRAPGPG